jgi:hypothetical protein
LEIAAGKLLKPTPIGIMPVLQAGTLTLEASE